MFISLVTLPDTEDQCEYILVVATSTEEKQLLEAAKDLDIPVATSKKRLDPERKARVYYRFGGLGANRVNAIRVEMGPHGYRGSAAMAMRYKTAFRAQGIICLGTAFGVDRAKQKLGDVLVARALYPYEARDAVCLSDVTEPEPENDAAVTEPARSPQRTGFRYSYQRVQSFPSHEPLYRLFERHRKAWRGHGHDVQLGGLLTGATRLLCGGYRDDLVAGVAGALHEKVGKPGGLPPPIILPPIVGGEMEGVGLLSVCHPEEPSWIVVKAISDFADGRNRETREAHTARAARNSARYVLTALRSSTPTDMETGDGQPQP